ncbi:MAG: EF-P beta-lysylation protein EpmB [Acidobacteriota bacterium]
MITRTLDAGTSPPAAGFGPSRRPARWQSLLSQGVSSAEELLDLLGLDPGAADCSPNHFGFPIRVPRSFVSRMRPGDPRDPLLLQVLSRTAEGAEVDGWVAEPLEEARFSPVPGLLHKYRSRVLLVATGACAIHCRYCFRRHFPYGEHAAARWQPALDYVAGQPSIEEVILSGGDPLSLRDSKLADLEQRLSSIPHVSRLRIHTRLPIVLPERVDEGLLAWLGGSRLQTVMVVHCNHPNEIDPAVAAALGRLRDAGVMLLNQSVLLRGINDSSAILRDLSVALFKAGVMPYYLHVMDRVAGASHFDVPRSAAEHLIQEMRATCSGYLVPTLVREEPGALSKTPLGA